MPWRRSGLVAVQMTTRLVVVSDTHIPQRARGLSQALWSDIEAADVVIHAGDWIDPVVLDEFEQRSQRLIGVYGNNDGAEMRQRLPLVAHATIEGVRISVVHETGPAAGRELRGDRDFVGTDLLLFGHSHIPWDSVSSAGMRLLNPGSPTDRRRQSACTYLRLSIDAGMIVGTELVVTDRAMT